MEAGSTQIRLDWRDLETYSEGVIALTGMPCGGGILSPAIERSANPADAINSVSRAGLNLTLIEAAAACKDVELVFDHPCLDVDLDAPAGVFLLCR